MGGEMGFTGTREEWWTLVVKNKNNEIKKLKAELKELRKEQPYVKLNSKIISRNI